jgi:transcriptional regulator with XRE-family HTH domain
MAEESAATEKRIGAAIGRFRREKAVTLETLAQRCGMSKGYLSKLERGLASPPVSTLSRIARALGVDIVDFFERGASSAPIVRIKKDERRPISRDGTQYGYRYESIAFGRGRKLMEPFILTFVPDTPAEGTFTHEGEEMVFVLEGRMRFFHGDRELVCEEGDCLYFDASVPHRGESFGDEETKVLIVMATGQAE